MMIGTMIGIIFTLVQQITSYLGLLLNVSPVAHDHDALDRGGGAWRLPFPASGMGSGRAVNQMTGGLPRR